MERIAIISWNPQEYTEVLCLDLFSNSDKDFCLGTRRWFLPVLSQKENAFYIYLRFQKLKFWCKFHSISCNIFLIIVGVIISFQFVFSWCCHCWGQVASIFALRRWNRRPNIQICIRYCLLYIPAVILGFFGYILYISNWVVNEVIFR